MENDYYKRYEPFFGSWFIRRFIGKGSYGRVFEIERKDAFGTVYTGALKAITVPTSEDELENLLANGMDRDSASTYFRNYAEGLNREIALMSRLKGHSNIVSYEDHDIRPHEDGMGWDMLIRMELLTPITSFQKANKPFTRRQVIQLGIDLCRALEVCQKYNIIHRDIKPANIFLSETGDFKLGDFGVARIASASTGASTRAGTVNYMAPEVFRSEKYTSNVDLYSLGLVMYQLLNANRMPLCPPYPQLMTPDQWEQANARRLSGAALPPPVNADGRLAEIVLKACAPNSAGRYETPALMRQALEAILYTEQETKDIYPEGDALPLPETGENASPAPRPGTGGETVNVWVKMRQAGGESAPAEPLPAAGTLTEKAPAKQELGPEREKAPETAPHEAGNETQVLFKAQEEARRKAEEAARRDEEARRAAEETARQAESTRREQEEARRKAEEERQAKARKAEMQIEPTGKAPAERMHPTPKKNRKPLVIGGVVTAAVIAACCFAVLNGSKASVPVASASAEASEQASMVDSAVVVELPAAASAAESDSTSREESASTSIPESSSVSSSRMAVSSESEKPAASSESKSASNPVNSSVASKTAETSSKHETTNVTEHPIKVGSTNGLYTGQWKNDAPFGQGKAVYENGDVYEGGWDEKGYNGYGVYTFSGGDVYKGNFAGGVIAGQGRYDFSNGDSYEGMFASGQPNGEGVYTCADGSIYIGHYENGQRNGQGKMTYTVGSLEGCVYEGSWLNDLPHGQGTLSYPDGRVKSGTWRIGLFLG